MRLRHGATWHAVAIIAALSSVDILLINLCLCRVAECCTQRPLATPQYGFPRTWSVSQEPQNTRKTNIIPRCHTAAEFVVSLTASIIKPMVTDCMDKGRDRHDGRQCRVPRHTGRHVGPSCGPVYLGLNARFVWLITDLLRGIDLKGNGMEMKRQKQREGRDRDGRNLLPEKNTYTRNCTQQSDACCYYCNNATSLLCSFVHPFADHIRAVIIMVALCNRADHYIFILFLSSSSSSFFFSSPNLSGRRLDVYHTLAHGVALVRI